MLWYFLFQASLGLTWDIRWHGAVGRDSFWTPPHLLIYSGVLFSGLLCLLVVLVDTARYRRGAPGVNDRTTWPALHIFHAPLGFIVAGCGAVTLLVAAPLDNWWHTLYGIDVALWTPFHMMGVFGAIVAAVGSIYAFAALAPADRRDRENAASLFGFRPFEWATLLAFAILLTLYSTALQPATTIAPTFDAGPLRLLTYPLLLAAVLPGLLTAAVRATGRAGAATALILLYTGRQLLAAAIVPWGINMTVEFAGYTYRAGEPRFSWLIALSSLVFLPTAVVVDLVARRSPATTAWNLSMRPRALTAIGLAGAAPLLALAPLLVGRPGAARAQLPAGFIIPTIEVAPAALLAVAPGLVLSIIGVAVGSGWGALLRFNDR